MNCISKQMLEKGDYRTSTTPSTFLVKFVTIFSLILLYNQCLIIYANNECSCFPYETPTKEPISLTVISNFQQRSYRGTNLRAFQAQQLKPSAIRAGYRQYLGAGLGSLSKVAPP